MEDQRTIRAFTRLRELAFAVLYYSERISSRERWSPEERMEDLRRYALDRLRPILESALEVPEPESDPLDQTLQDIDPNTEPRGYWKHSPPSSLIPDGTGALRPKGRHPEGGALGSGPRPLIRGRSSASPHEAADTRYRHHPPSPVADRASPGGPGRCDLATPGVLPQDAPSGLGRKHVYQGTPRENPGYSE